MIIRDGDTLYNLDKVTLEDCILTGHIGQEVIPFRSYLSREQAEQSFNKLAQTFMVYNLPPRNLTAFNIDASTVNLDVLVCEFRDIKNNTVSKQFVLEKINGWFHLGVEDLPSGVFLFYTIDDIEYYSVGQLNVNDNLVMVQDEKCLTLRYINTPEKEPEIRIIRIVAEGAPIRPDFNIVIKLVPTKAIEPSITLRLKLYQNYDLKRNLKDYMVKIQSQECPAQFRELGDTIIIDGCKYIAELDQNILKLKYQGV